MATLVLKLLCVFVIFVVAPLMLVAWMDSGRPPPRN